MAVETIHQINSQLGNVPNPDYFGYVGIALVVAYLLYSFVKERAKG